jgi:hypothetical protein
MSTGSKSASTGAAFTAWFGTFALLVAIRGVFLSSLAVGVVIGLAAAIVARLGAGRGRGAHSLTIVGGAAIGGAVLVGELALLLIAVMFFSH